MRYERGTQRSLEVRRRDENLYCSAANISLSTIEKFAPYLAQAIRNKKDTDLAGLEAATIVAREIKTKQTEEALAAQRGEEQEEKQEEKQEGKHHTYRGPNGRFIKASSQMNTA